MGINCRPMGKLRKDFKRIDRMNEEEQKRGKKGPQGER